MPKPKVAKIVQPTIPGLDLPVPANPFKAGVSTTSSTGQSFFVPTPQATAGMNVGQRAQFAAGRLAGDVLLDASRSQWWKYNATEAIARTGFDKLAGGSKVGGALSGFAGIQALGNTSGAFDATNIGQGFRPKGFQAAFPSEKSLTVPENPLKEIVGRYVLGKGGRMLPYDQFAKERPDVSQAQYDKYASYLKASPDAMPAGTVDIGGFGVLKATSEGINGPEARFLGTPVTPGAIAVGTGTAVSAATVWKGASAPKMGVVPKSAGSTMRLPGGKSLQLGRTNPALAIGGALISAGSELQGALKDQASLPEVVLRTGLSPLTSSVGAIAQPIQKAGVSAINLAKDIGDFATGNYSPRQSYQRQQASEQAISQGWDSAPKNIARSLLGQPANAATVKADGQSSEPTPQPQTEADRVYAAAGDRLAKVSAERKLVVVNGKYKSVPRDAGDLQGVRGTVTHVSDGDTYTVRTYDPKTKQYANQQVRVGNIDTRETADHASSGDFQNHMIGKQKKEQGFTSDGAVFRQGEKDKQAAAKLVPVGSVVSLNNVGEAAHNRMAATVGQEGSNRDVGGQLVASGNATEFKKKEVSSGGGGNPDALKIAQLRDGQGGSSDRSNTSRERVADVGARSRVQVADTTGKYRLGQETIKQQGAMGVATIKGRAQMGTADITGRYRVAQEGVKQQGAMGVATIKGRAQMGTADITGRYRVGQETIKQQGQVAIADRNLYGTKYTADARVAQEGVKQGGQIQTAKIKGDAQISSANAGASAKVRTAAITRGYETGDGGVQSAVGIYSGASKSDADRGGQNNVRAASLGNDAQRDADNAVARQTFATQAAMHSRIQGDAAAAAEKRNAARMKAILGY